ncbi:MAG TPA: glycosyltransferase family 2 protein [Flavisolibacter sp.]|nr:glycosyltransferase family 2 protein [Flavisolibacter sp.]
MPRISVILPVYNAQKYLREAIDSILAQTFADFELLLINDGSTDGSEEVIRSYSDPRIIYIKNEENSGLINTLNKGIELAKGDYIARMDGDDVALPERLEKQVSHLEKNNIALLATTYHSIDKDGNLLPAWPTDRATITPEQIKKTLPRDNCIAHPTTMAKSWVFKKYRYHPELVFTYKFIHNQTYSEDYDLWLRIAADGLVIEKLPEPLLLYRVLPNSVTRFGTVNIFYRLARIKFRFLRNQIKRGKISFFHCKVFFFACIDILKGVAKQLKKKVRN